MRPYWLLAPVVSFMLALGSWLIHAETVSNVILKLTFVLWLGTAAYPVCFGRGKTSYRVCRGMFVAAGLLALYWDSMFLASGETVSAFFNRLLGTACLNLAVPAWGYTCVRTGREDRKKAGQGEGRLNLAGILPYMAFVLVIIILSAETLDDWYRWDSYYYVSQLEAANQADFTLGLLGPLNLVNHLCSVYSMLALTLGRFLSDIPLGARLLNWLLLFWAGSCFFRLLKSTLPENCPGYSFLCTLIFLVSPWAMGFIGEVSLDYAGFCALTALFWYLYDEDSVMSAVAASLLVFSKEPGVVACGAMALVVWLLCIERQKGSERWSGWLPAAWRAVWNGRVLALGIPMVLWLAQYVRLSHWGATDSSHFFGYNGGFLRQKAVTLFTLNFTWLLLLILLVSWVAARQDKKKGRGATGRLWPIAAGTIAFLLFDVSFVTFNHARYNFLFIPGLFFGVFYWYGRTALAKKRMGMVLPAGVGILLAIQTFWQIDPVSKALERTVSIGESRIVSTNWNFGINDFGDAVVTNRQYTYLDEALDRALEKIGYEDGKAFVLPGCFNVFQGVEPEYVYYGLMGGYVFRLTDIYWNAETGRRNLDSGVLLRSYVMTDEFVSQDVPEHLYYISVPWYEEDTERLSHYKIVNESQVCYRGWTITIYELGEKTG